MYMGICFCWYSYDINIIIISTAKALWPSADATVSKIPSTQDTVFEVLFVFCAADIPEEEARYWAKKLEQLNAMRDQDVSSASLSLHHLLSVLSLIYLLFFFFK